MNSNQIGAIVGVAFGWAWGVAGSVAFRGAWRSAGIAAAIFVSAILVYFVCTSAFPSSGRFNGAIYGVAVTLEVVGILIAAAILNRTGQPSFVPPAVTVIVGLHFIGLWLAANQIVFLWLASALCVVGIGAALTPVTSRLPATGWGSAIALWASVAATLVRL